MKNLLENTGAGAMNEMVSSTHDLPYQMGCYGEAFCQLPFVFVGSTVRLEPLPMAIDPEVQLCPLPNESFVTLDWSLPLTEFAQELLWRRVRRTFDRATGMVPTHQKKRYRQTTEELLRVRNMVALYGQIHDHLSGRLNKEEMESWVREVQEGEFGRDEDLVNLMNHRPESFSVSMLLSEQQAAKSNLQSSEAKKTERVEKQRQEVTDAQWKFFQAALEQDHDEMEKVKSAPASVRQLLHAKQVQHRTKLISSANAACVGYQAGSRPNSCRLLVSLHHVKRKGSRPTSSLLTTACSFLCIMGISFLVTLVRN